jgi:hypothetical protein
MKKIGKKTCRYQISGITFKYTQYRNIGKPNYLKAIVCNKNKGPKQDSKNRLS